MEKRFLSVVELNGKRYLAESISNDGMLYNAMNINNKKVTDCFKDYLIAQNADTLKNITTKNGVFSSRELTAEEKVAYEHCHGMFCIAEVRAIPNLIASTFEDMLGK